MGFAQPIMLAFLGLFIPVIALYLLKQRRRRVQVSTLLFWDKILKDEQTVTSLTRLKKILSLLLQPKGDGSYQPISSVRQLPFLADDPARLPHEGYVNLWSDPDDGLGLNSSCVIRMETEMILSRW